MDLVTVSVGVGLLVSLLLSELFGLAAGGMVVPGYLALFFHRPLLIVTTILAALITYAIVRGLSKVMIIYGKRRTTMMILIGFLLGAGIRLAAQSIWGPSDDDAFVNAADFSVIGFIIPGLIAIWIDRQGVWETLSIVLTASGLVRLLLVMFGLELMA